jgi:hypothetical protein
MFKNFSPPINATTFDICLNTYGTLDLLSKLLLDNNITNVNYLSVIGDVFIYDFSLVKDYETNLKLMSDNIKFITGDKIIQELFIDTNNYIQTEQPLTLQDEQGDDFIVD